MKIEEYANRIIDIAKIKYVDISNQDNIPIRSFGIGENSIAFEGDDAYIEFHKSLEILYQHVEEIFNTYSFKQFEKDFINFIRPYIESKTKLTKKIIDSFYKKMTDSELNNYFIIRGINGIELSNTLKSLSIGPFSIFHSNLKEEILKSHSQILPEIVYRGWDSFQYLITYTLQSRDSTKAQFISDEKFYQFELFVKYSFGSYSDDYNIGILSVPFWYYDKAIIIDDTTISTPSSIKGSFKKFKLDDDYFFNTTLGHDALWRLLEKLNPNKIENRIISAIEWIGRANTEPNLKNRFLQYVISYESLFTISEKALITPSIANQISEGFALLLGKNYDERIKIESRIKDIYGIRSAIAHGASKNITEENANEACQFAIDIIRKFLTDKSLLSISDPSDLNKYLKKLKYS